MSVCHGDRHSVVVALHLFGVIHLDIFQLILHQQSLAKFGQREEDNSSTDDKANNENPVLPCHGNHTESCDLETNKEELIRVFGPFWVY